MAGLTHHPDEAYHRISDEMLPHSIVPLVRDSHLIVL